MTSRILRTLFIILLVNAVSLIGFDAGLQACAAEIDAISLAMEGTKLTQKDVADLEAAVTANPLDLDARTRLLGYYFGHSFTDKKAKKAKANHVLWIIENRPESAVAGTSFAEMDPTLDGDAFFEAKQLWKKQVEKFPANTAILSNAAAFMLLSDRELAEELLKRLQILEPDNPEWKKRLGFLYSLEAKYGAAQEENSEKALKQLEEAYNATESEEERFSLLNDMPSVAFKSGDIQKAVKYANELLEMSKKFEDNWNFGNAVHDAHTTLGRVAVKEGRIDDAKKHLLDSSRIEGSPQLDSFGPSMDLAKDLLDRGEKNTVIAYLTMCGNFWKDDYGALTKWITEIKKTGTSKLEK